MSDQDKKLMREASDAFIFYCRSRGIETYTDKLEETFILEFNKHDAILKFKKMTLALAYMGVALLIWTYDISQGTLFRILLTAGLIVSLDNHFTSCESASGKRLLDKIDTYVDEHRDTWKPKE